MIDESQPFLITREALRDGSLIEAVRRQMPSGMPVRTDAEIKDCLEIMLADHPTHEDVWLFGYGSLMWNPAMHFVEQRGGRVMGWHRSYCLWLEAGRGSPEKPGLMLALDRGGAAAGALFRVPADQARAELLLPFRRELFTYDYEARWVSVAARAGPVRAVTFVVNRDGPRYERRLDLERVARHIATASGRLGSCLEYLHSTLASLEALGLNDRMLREVHRLCTQRANTVHTC
ncbi:MAG: gamma-glutamylcyclotransferase [Acetobacteraceae bacterium]|nr:gamma-glutamylcyclotransferase [Acetobacteraceae bacterium]